MSVWAIILLAGQVAGYQGPLPVSMSECITESMNANLQTQQILEAGTRPDGFPLTKENLYFLENVKFICKEAKEAPKVGSKIRL